MQYAQVFCMFLVPIHHVSDLILWLVRGNLKKAMNRLRGGSRIKTHHSSTFRSGLLIGAAVPAFASGIYCSALLIPFDVRFMMSITGRYSGRDRRAD